MGQRGPGEWAGRVTPCCSVGISTTQRLQECQGNPGHPSELWGVGCVVEPFMTSPVRESSKEVRWLVQGPGRFQEQLGGWSGSNETK